MAIEDDIGLAAAWMHLRLAGRALGRPTWRTVDLAWRAVWGQRHIDVMTVYLGFNVLLYGALALAFLGSLHQPTLAHASPLVSSFLARLVWGALMLGVCLAQPVAFFVGRRWTWTVFAVLTAMAAGALLSASVIDMVTRTGNWLSVFFFVWVTGMHLLLINHRLVPLPQESVMEQDAELLARLEQFARPITTVHGNRTTKHSKRTKAAG